MAGLPVFRVAIPAASLAEGPAQVAMAQLREFLAERLKHRFKIEAVLAGSYAAIGRELLNGSVELGWTPPVVAARVEVGGGHPLVRAVRNGSASYRAALVCRADRSLEVTSGRALRGAWVDKDSTAGYWLPRAWARAHGIDSDQDERFTGSYRASLDEVSAGRADFTAVFASSAPPSLVTPALAELPPEQRAQLHVFGVTDETPSDALCAGPRVAIAVRQAVELALLDATADAQGRAMLEGLFGAERFERVPPYAYRPLYGIVLAATGLASSIQTCAACGGRLSLQARFCERCAEPTGRGQLRPSAPRAPVRTAAEPSRAPSLWSEERKLATVMFADLVGFTAISSRLEPDEVQEFANACFVPLTSEIERRGGTVIKYIGDCIMAAFGVPVAAEDDAIRAAQAAKAMCSRLAEVGKVGVRIGLNTGLVMVGAVGGKERAALDVMGAAVNLASRIQSAASPGDVLVGAATQRLIQDVFELEALPPAHLKGIEGLVALYRVGAEKGDGAATPTITTVLDAPFQLREPELSLLISSFESVARRAEPSVVRLIGEAGLGKARLLRELREQLAADPREPEVFWAGAARGPIQASAAPLALVARLIKSRFAVGMEEPLPVARARVVAGIQSVFAANEQQSARETAELLADICGLGVAEALLPSGPAAEVKDQGFRAFADWIHHLAKLRPVCLIAQNLQWADDASLDFLERLLVGSEHLPVLLVASSRAELDERRPGWPAVADQAVTVQLGAVPEPRMREFVDFLVADVAELPLAIRDAIVSRSEGNPECARDLLRLLIDRNAIEVRQSGPWIWHPERAGEITLPDTVQGVLQARLDALPREEKELLKRASVIGKLFLEGTLESLTPPQLRAGLPGLLASLEARGLVRARQDSAPGAPRQLGFRTQALRDAAYGSMPRAGREAAHRVAALWLEQHPQVTSHTEVAAQFEAAAEPALARPHLIAAARQYAAIYAHREAADFYERGLRAWPSAENPGDRSDARRELATVLTHMSRYEEALAVLDEVRLEAHAANGPQLSTRLAWADSQRAVALRDCGRLDEALLALDQALEDLKDRMNLPGLVLLGQRAFIRSAKGDNAGALADCTEGLDLAPQIAEQAEGWHFAVVRLNNSLGALHMRAGRLDEAQRCLETALELCAGARNPAARWTVTVHLGIIAFERGEYPKAAQYFEQALGEARKSQRKIKIATCLSNLGQARLGAGDLQSALELLEEARSLSKAGGMHDIHADSARALAETHLALGNFAIGLERATEAIALARQSGDSRFEVKAHAAAMDCLLGGTPNEGDRARAAEHLLAAVTILDGSGSTAESAELKARFQQLAH